MDTARDKILSEINLSEKYHMILLKTNEQRGGWGVGRRQTKKMTLNYKEQTDGYQRGGGWGMGEIGDGD